MKKKSLEVYIFGCFPTHRISNERYQKIRAFWEGYLRMGAGSQ